MSSSEDETGVKFIKLIIINYRKILPIRSATDKLTQSQALSWLQSDKSTY